MRLPANVALQQPGASKRPYESAFRIATRQNLPYIESSPAGERGR